MNKKCTVSIINTQMQMMNCIEAIHHFGTSNNFLIIANIARMRNKQLLNLSERCEFRKEFVKVYNIRLVNSDLRFAAVINYLLLHILILYITKMHEIDFVFVGNYNNVIHRNLAFHGSANGSRTVVVDDGTAAIINRKHRIEEMITNKPFYDCSRIDRFIFDKGRKGIPSSIIHFSIYQEGVDTECDSLIVNDYCYLKKMMQTNGMSAKYKNSIIVVGQPLIENKYVTYETYIRYINRIKEYFGIEKMFYFAHPVETYIVEHKEDFNFEVVKSDVPFELFVACLPSKTKVVGFYSSAIPNVKFFNGEVEVYYVKIPNELTLVSEDKNNEIDMVCKSFDGVKKLTI